MADGVENPRTYADDPRTYFAAERTFLAWIRTGLGLMGVGFAVARFALFLRTMQASEGPKPIHTGLSLYAGVALVVLGVAVNVSAAAHHLRTVRELRTGKWVAGRPSRTALTLAIALALGGVAIAAYLLLLR
jgi:putative membrane protein